jgi:hypothetical protein
MPGFTHSTFPEEGGDADEWKSDRCVLYWIEKFPKPNSMKYSSFPFVLAPSIRFSARFPIAHFHLQVKAAFLFYSLDMKLCQILVYSLNLSSGSAPVQNFVFPSRMELLQILCGMMFCWKTILV